MPVQPETEPLHITKSPVYGDNRSLHAPSEAIAWFALQVATQKEKPVASLLSDKGYQCFLPIYSRRRFWSDRVAVSSVPLFPGYVFCRFDVRHRLPVLVTPNVRGVVGHGKIPAPISEQELDAIRAALRNGFVVEPCDSLREGDAVRVAKGPLTGIEGLFVRYRGADRLILSIPLIQRSVAVEMDRLCVEPIHRSVRV